MILTFTWEISPEQKFYNNICPTSQPLSFKTKTFHEFWNYILICFYNQNLKNTLSKFVTQNNSWKKSRTHDKLKVLILEIFNKKIRIRFSFLYMRLSLVCYYFYIKSSYKKRCCVVFINTQTVSMTWPEEELSSNNNITFLYDTVSLFLLWKFISISIL